MALLNKHVQDRMDRFFQLHQEIKRLEELKDKAQAHIVEAMKEDDVQTVQADYGTFSLGLRKTYEYSDKVKSAMEVVKEVKKREEEDGTAVAKETEYLAFREVKA